MNLAYGEKGDNLFVIMLSDSVQKNTNDTTSNPIEENRYKNMETQEKYNPGTVEVLSSDIY